MAREELHDQPFKTPEPTLLESKPRKPLTPIILAIAGLVLAGVGIFISLLFPQLLSKKAVQVNASQPLESFYTNVADYENAFTKGAAAHTHQAYVAITSHHFLAKELIARTVQGVNATQLKTVLIVGPDHFGALTRDSVLGITTTDDWNTPFGVLQPDQPTLEMLQTLTGVESNRTPFLTEHSIYTLVPFVKKQFPTVKVVPLILRQSENYAAYEKLGSEVAQNLHPEETLVLISSDFSHETPSSVAKLDDAKSVAALKSLQLSQLNNVNADCRVCMAFSYGYLAGKKSNFHLFENTNSFEISGQDEQRVTSYVSGYFLRPHDDAEHDADDHESSNEMSMNMPDASLIPAVSAAPTPSPTATSNLTLLFGGDLMFDRNIRLRMREHGYTYPLEKLESTFSQYDLVIANLEGPVTANPSRSVGSVPGSSSNFIFTFDPQIPKTLRDQHLSIVNLGNNHILNFGVQGVRDTKSYLSKAELTFFGDTSTETGSKDRVALVERKGVKLAFVNYNQFVINGFEHAVEDIKWARPKADIVIVLPHWGNEYVPTANQVIQNTAHELIDAGADTIIGGHPHVIENVEQYKGKTIYYSLGNLVFDQYFSKETQLGLLVGVEIDPQTKSLKFSEQRVNLKSSGQTELATSSPSPSPQK